jgi:parallel beta-helix repeat protein
VKASPSRSGARSAIVILLMVLLGSSAFLSAGAASASGVHPAIGFGVVTIGTNGAISNPSAPISESGSTYTLTGELIGSLVVLASNVVINGAGNTVDYQTGETNGDGSAVSVNSTTGVTVENFRELAAIKGIDVNNSSGALVENNQLSQALSGSEVFGIVVGNSTNVQVSNNDANNTTYTSIYALNSTQLTVSNNVADSGYGTSLYTNGLFFDRSSELTVTGNVVVGSPDAILAEYASTAYFSNNNVSLGPSYDSDGLGIEYSENVLVVGTHAFATGYGVWAQSDTNVTFSGNSAPYDYIGLYDYEDVDFTATDNYAPFASWTQPSGEGIYSYYSANSTFDGNNVSGSLGDGAFLKEVDGVTLHDNNLSNAAIYGVYAYYGYGPTNISGNNVSSASVGSSYGVYADENYGAVLIDDNTFWNQQYGVYAEDNFAVTSILENTFAGADITGVYAAYNYGDLTVNGNTFLAVGTGVADEYAYGGWLTVSGNRIANYTSEGIDDWNYEEGASGATITNNVITNNSAGDGVYFYEDQGPTTVTGNDFSNDEYGVYDYYQFGGFLDIANNNITGSSDYGVYTEEVGEGGPHDEYSTAPVTIENNDLEGSVDGIYADDTTGNLTITGNALLDVDYGVDIEEVIGSALIAGNDVQHTGGGIYVNDAYGGADVAVSGNDVDHSDLYGIELYEDYEPDLITDNTARDSNGTAIFEDSNEIGGSLIANNNATGSHESLNVTGDAEGPAVILGNDLSHSGDANVTGAYVTTFAGNDLIGDHWVNFTLDNLGTVDHNDFPSGAFNESENHLASGFWNASYPVGGNYWTGYTGVDDYSGPGQNVAGSDGIGDTPYALDGATDRYPLMTPWANAKLTFTETGLPVGAPWTITLNGIAETVVAGSAISFAQVNGANTAFHYAVSLPTPTFRASASGGSGTENGKDQSFAVTFTPVQYAVTFTWPEPTDAGNWSITLGGASQSSNTGSLVFEETNGTYDWSVVLPGGYSATPAAGSVTVSGANVTTTLNVKAPTVTITFVLTGAPSGASWSVALNSGTPQSSTGTSITFTVAVGKYSFAVTPPSGKTVAPATGSLNATTGLTTVYVSVVPGSSSTTSTTTSISTGLLDGLYIGLLAALILAIVGWAMYVRKGRGGASTAPPPTMPAWSPAPAGANAPPPPPPTGPGGSP